LEIAAFLGLIVGVGLLVWAMVSGSSLATFWDPASLRIVLGGTLAAMAISHGGRHLKRLPGLMLRAFRKSQSDLSGLRDQLVELANQARREGLLSLEDSIEEIESEFLAEAVQMLVDAVPPDQIEELLNNQVHSTEEFNQRGIRMFRTAGAVSPAFGMIGTLIGLIQMLRDLDDPDMIGMGMAVALTTTLYGTLLANLLFNPVANKLEEWNRDEMQVKSMVMEGILAIQDGQNPRFIKGRLDAYITAPGKKTERAEEAEGTAEVSDAHERESIASDD